ncbi:hypothetical protein QBZ16_002807 [Prototheca wickerhamii]|uniref:Uncharacterized protein n=1 Tax=Prototheca wickerhamii TaxID=3111 RepID=A0AAD9IIK6_PROWI|nr:hypothetical protein QBZ16_002807 [Prototheca wickerhamii]
MADFLGKPYMGPASTPHIPTGAFATFSIGCHLALFAAAMPGRFLGTVVHPRRYNRELIMSCSTESAQTQAKARGRKTKQWYRRPRFTADSWEKMWNRHLHWKRSV